jgi:addiction module RelE/StbE family toxin
MQTNSFKFKLSPKAKQDILDICKYIKTKLKNIKAAKDLNDKFKKAFNRAAQFPYSGKEYKNNYRKIIIDNYIAFYEIDEENKIIRFYRVLYGHMNYEKIIK